MCSPSSAALCWWDRGQQRDSPGGPGRSLGSRWDEHTRCPDRGRSSQIAADSDDDVDYHPRPATTGTRHRRRIRRPGPAGTGGCRRPHRIDADHVGAYPGCLFIVSSRPESESRVIRYLVNQNPGICFGVKVLYCIGCVLERISVIF